MPTIQLLIAVFSFAPPTTESISSQHPQHVLLAALGSSTILLQEVASAMQDSIQSSKSVDKVPEALNATHALHLFVRPAFRLLLLNARAALMALLPTLMEIALASLDFTKMALFALLAQLSVLPAESEEYAILVLILPLEAWLTTATASLDSLIQEQLFAMSALLFARPAAQPQHALHASLIKTEPSSTDSVFALPVSIKLSTKTEALPVDNAPLHALPALFSQLFAQTATPVPTEFSDSTTKETKFVTVCLDTLPTQMETVFNLTALLILTAQPARLS